jgi:sugar phosphate isomerase/epimerase
LIRPLDEGNFDVPGFLKSLDAVGYKGPVGLQCYQVPGAPEEHLKRSITQWKKMINPTAINSTRDRGGNYE